MLTWLETSLKDEINWNSSYAHHDDIPLGSKIFFESWKTTAGDSLKKIAVPPYEFLNSTEADASGTYFFFNSSIGFDHSEGDLLLEWVAKGNTLFVSAHQISSRLKDTLNFELKSNIEFDGLSSAQNLNFYNPILKLEEDLYFDKQVAKVYFSKIDTLQHEVLGYTRYKQNGNRNINFIRSKFGKGTIYLHTAPQVFSNYTFLENDGYRYTSNLLAYIPKKNIYWDTYYKDGKNRFSSPLYILLNQKALKWAYYTILLCVLLYIIFEGKRKQRAIPVVEPPKNRSYEYTETISNLFLEQKKFEELGDKKIDMFFEFIRQVYRLHTSKIDSQFLNDLSAKSGNDLETTKKLFNSIKSFKERKNNSKEEFLALSTSINLYKITHGKTGSK